ncbi:TPA: PIN domain-containing protein [Enterobacter roggenkampii]
MRSTYPGFYSTTDEALRDIWNSRSTLFVFDANCLLNLYRCEEHTRKEILNVMEELSSRTWIPFQVGYEYQKNRRKVIQDSINSLTTIQSELQKSYTHNVLSQGSIKKHLNTALSQEVTDLQKEIEKIVEKYLSSKIQPRVDSKNEVSRHDFIRDEIDKIINDNIGSLPDQQKINEINAEGEKRYSNEIPPGFKDNKSEINHFSGIELTGKFGDLYLWKEIIEKASAPDITSVVFVCDDTKTDWWYIQNGKTHGPLEALKTEICKESSVENFSLINQSTFLLHAKKYLGNVTVSESSVQEVKVLSNIASSEKITEDNSDVEITLGKRAYSEFDKYIKDSLSLHRTVSKKPLDYYFNSCKQAISDFTSVELRARKIHSKVKSLNEDEDDYETETLEKIFELRDELVEYMIQAKHLVNRLERVMLDYSANELIDSDLLQRQISRLERWNGRVISICRKIATLLR